MSSVGEEMPKEMARVREVLSLYHNLGPAGFIGGKLIELALQRADEAMASGDVVEILKSYKELKTIED